MEVVGESVLPWSELFSTRGRRIKSSAIRELLKVTEQPHFISFAGGFPAPELFPVDAIAETIQDVMNKMGPQALQYSATEGYRPLRQWVADYMREVGVPAAVENVLITTGSQQALDLLGRVRAHGAHELRVVSVHQGDLLPADQRRDDQIQASRVHV